jgi:uncharacterized protein YecE (DUF72 family)
MSGQEQSPEEMGRTKPSVVRVGPAGWSYPDWKGYVYPERRVKGFHEVEYLAQFFDTVEINSSFYSPIRPEHAKLWIERVAANPHFLFTAKLWQRFTHERIIPGKGSAADEKEVRGGFEVLRTAGKLGAVLLQFPFSFHCTSETRAYLEALLGRFDDYPLVVEVRHATWNVPEVFELLRGHGAGFCNIDQPLIGRSIRPSAETTAPVGYVRLHGRRYDTWFTEDAEVPAHERYNYLYSSGELRPWAERVGRVAEGASDVYVITNNHYQGKAVVNALELIAMLKKSKVKVPDPLRERFPELERIASEPAEAPRLF